MFILQSSPIDPLKLKNSYTNPSNGAFVNFEGIVRNDKNHQKEVNSLLYIADESSCKDNGQKIVSEAMQQFNLMNALCIQRIGQVDVSQSAIWIGVWSTHRDEAFKGCRYIIEETKHRLLIWKKELYKDGTSAWIQGKERPVIV